jgi:hypothetical protein
MTLEWAFGPPAGVCGFLSEEVLFHSSNGGLGIYWQDNNLSVACPSILPRMLQNSESSGGEIQCDKILSISLMHTNYLDSLVFIDLL